MAGRVGTTKRAVSSVNAATAGAPASLGSTQTLGGGAGISTSYAEFWNCTRQDIDDVVEQISDGYYVLDRAQKLMRRIIQLHAALAKDIKSLVEYEKEKLPQLSAKASMDIQIMSSWSGFLDISMLLADGYEKFANVGAAHVYNPIGDEVEKSKVLIVDAQNEAKAVYGSIEKINVLVDRSVTKTQKSLQQFQGKVNLGMPIPKGDPKRARAELQNVQKIFDLLEAHQTTVDSCNEAVAEIQGSQLQKLLNAVQFADEKRMEILSNALNQYSSTMHLLSDITTANDKRTKEFSEAMPKYKRSLESKLQHITSSFGLAGKTKGDQKAQNGPPKVYRFDTGTLKQVEERIQLLQVECGEVPSGMAASMVALQSKNSEEYKTDDIGLFAHGTIEEIVQLENKMLGQKTEEPLIVNFLVDQLVALGGCRTQGIFRKTPDIRVLNSIKDKLQAFDYTLNNTEDPHIPAELIKQFLRSLSEPLIPTEHYEYCVGVAKAIDIKKGPSEEVLGCFEDLLYPKRWLPLASLYTIRKLAGFLKVASDEDHIELTKMTLGNFAIVFAPNMLRCKPGSLDAKTQMKNAEYESRFVEYLFKYVIIADQALTVKEK